MPPLPHHRAYGSVPRRFGGLSANERVHGDQTETTETGIGEGAVQSFGEAQPPGSLWAKDGRTGRPFGDPEPTELTIALAARLPLDPRDATQAPPNPAVQRWQLVPLAEAKVTGPTPHERVQVGNHPLQTDAPVPPRQLTDPVFEPGHGLVGDAPPEQRVVPDHEAKERPLPRSGDGTLLRVDLKLEAAFDEVGQACHDPSACLFAADIDVTVSRAGESHPRALAEPYVTLPRHTAPIVQPRPCSSAQWANSEGCRRAMRAIQCAVCRRCRRKDLNFRCAHRARIRSMCRRVG